MEIAAHDKTEIIFSMSHEKSDFCFFARYCLKTGIVLLYSRNSETTVKGLFDHLQEVENQGFDVIMGGCKTISMQEFFDFVLSRIRRIRSFLRFWIRLEGFTFGDTDEKEFSVS